MRPAPDTPHRRIEHQIVGGLSGTSAERGAATADEFEPATIILDVLGKVVCCNHAAMRLFCDNLRPLAGRNIRALIPDFPLRPVTPGYNLAYATFWAAEGGWRQFSGRDSRRRLFRLEAGLDKCELESHRQILLNLRPLREAPTVRQRRFSERRVRAPNAACTA